MGNNAQRRPKEDPSSLLDDLSFILKMEGMEDAQYSTSNEYTGAALRSGEDIVERKNDVYNNIFKSVKNGEIENLRQVLLEHAQQLHIGKMSKNPLRQAKYACVVLATLVSRVAVEGGMDMEAAFLLSDAYIDKADRCETQYDVAKTILQMLFEYTRLVAEGTHMACYSQSTNSAIEYIATHLHYKIRVLDIAKQLGISQSHLCNKFKKETGVSLTKYILTRRLEEAKELLHFSKYNCEEISTIVGFSSPSYFTQQFRLAYQSTPVKYRAALSRNPYSFDNRQKK